MKSVKTFILYGVAFYLICLMALYALQKKMIFHPEKLSQDYVFNLADGIEEVSISTSDGETINGLYYKGETKETILYFHGNAGSLKDWQYISQDFTALGYSLLIIDYRGYGKSSGDITEEGLYLDATASFNFLKNNKGTPVSDIIIYGRSIGTGVAVELASQHATKGLILEAPFTSLKKLAHEKMPFFLPSLLLEFHFDNKQKINRVKSPVLFIHGSRDTLIPPAHSKSLLDEFKGKKKRLLIPNAGHNDVNNFPEYHRAIAETLTHFF